MYRIYHMYFMANKYFTKKHQNNRKNYYLLAHEVKLLKENYDFVKCTLSNRVLCCEGVYTQTEIEYRYRVIYDGTIPQAFIISPEITYNKHRYKDGSLCLYYHKDTPWKSGKMNLYNTIIPWIHEWILYYEIYRQTGKWLHSEVVHVNGKEKVVHRGVRKLNGK